MYGAEQAASQLPFWAQFPWGAIAIFAFGALIGTIYADIANTESQLRVWWRERHAFADFHQTYHKSIRYDRGENHGGIMQHAGIMLPVEFRRKIRLDAIRITGYVYPYMDHMPIDGKAWAMHVWKTAVGKEYLKGDRIEVPLAHIPYERGHPGCYGERGSTGYYMSDNSAHLLIVELMSDVYIQSKRFLVLLPSKSLFVLEDGSKRTTGGRFVVLEEGNVVFPSPPRDKANLFTVEK